MPTIDTLTNRWNFIKYTLKELLDKNNHHDDNNRNRYVWARIYSYMIIDDLDKYE